VKGVADICNVIVSINRAKINNQGQTTGARILVTLRGHEGRFREIVAPSGKNGKEVEEALRKCCLMETYEEDFEYVRYLGTGLLSRVIQITKSRCLK